MFSHIFDLLHEIEYGVAVIFATNNLMYNNNLLLHHILCHKNVLYSEL